MNYHSRRLLHLGMVAIAAAVAGCSEPPPPAFRLNMMQMVSNELDENYQREIANVLAALFGTPDEPIAPPDSGLDQSMLTLAAGPAWTDPEDVTHGLYRKHCVHCHGISGDGRGPTAPFLDPYPRDYRKGVFKFKSTYNAEKPTDDDLARVLYYGVPGTSMPSFALLPKPEIDALVEYVKYLALRGEMETALARYAFDELGEVEVEDEQGNPVMVDGQPKVERIPLDPAANADQASAVKDILAEIVAPWESASEMVIAPDEEQLPTEEPSPEELAESIALGRELFFGAKASCLKCHGPTALGDGEQSDFDVWMKEIDDLQKLATTAEGTIESRQEAPKDESDEQQEARERRLEREESRLASIEQVLTTALPKRNAIPRNLRLGAYRGGRRRLDIFYRIHAGIPGTPMPGVGAASPGAEGTVSDEEIWHIVDYVMSLPYEPISGPDQPRPAVEAEVIR